MRKPIKSLLLSAGLGTRLRPITFKIPKCLVEINNKPIMGYWFDNLENINVDTVLVNTHFLREKVDKFIKNESNRKFKIITTYEENLLGTAGTLISNKEIFINSTCILIHADNFTTFNLKYLVDAHYKRPENCLITMLTFITKTPETCGIVEVDSSGVVQSFSEKSSNPPGNLANGAVYVFDDELLDWLIKNHPSAFDFSIDIIPKLIGKIFTHQTDQPFIDIGTKPTLDEARMLSKEQN